MKDEIVIRKKLAKIVEEKNNAFVGSIRYDKAREKAELLEWVLL